MIKSAMFGFFKDKYYRLEEKGLVVIPTRYDYKTKAISSVLDKSSETGIIKAYQYYTDLLTDNNKERVEFMKQLLIDEKVTKIDDLNNDYVISVSYEIYNKDNMLIKSGSSSVKALYNTAYIQSDVSKLDTLEYRKAMIFDGSIEIQIPEISRYGIKNKYTQHPYTVKISKISICTTIGEKEFLDEETSQLNYDNYAHTSSVIHHGTPIMSQNNYGSHFVTNANVGTTLIDQTVISTVLDTDVECELIELASIDCKSNEFITKFDSKLKMITVDVEVIVDNCNMVYNQDDILDILESNEETDIPETPVNPPEENPSDTEEPVDDNKGDGGDINKNPSGEKEPTDNTGDVSDTPVNPPEETPSENVPIGGENTDTPPTDDNREPVEEVPSDTEDSTDKTDNNNTEEIPSEDVPTDNQEHTDIPPVDDTKEPTEDSKVENPSEEVPSDTEEDNTSDTSSSDDNLDNSGSTEEIPSEDAPTDNQEQTETPVNNNISGESGDTEEIPSN